MADAAMSDSCSCYVWQALLLCMAAAAKQTLLCLTAAAAVYGSYYCYICVFVSGGRAHSHRTNYVLTTY